MRTNNNLRPASPTTDGSEGSPSTWPAPSQPTPSRPAPRLLGDLEGPMGTRQILFRSPNPDARTMGEALQSLLIRARSGNTSADDHLAECYEIREAAEMLIGQLPVEKEVLEKLKLTTTPKGDEISSGEYLAICDELALHLHEDNGVAAVRRREGQPGGHEARAFERRQMLEELHNLVIGRSFPDAQSRQDAFNQLLRRAQSPRNNVSPALLHAATTPITRSIPREEMVQSLTHAIQSLSSGERIQIFRNLQRAAVLASPSTPALQPLLTQAAALPPHLRSTALSSLAGAIANMRPISYTESRQAFRNLQRAATSLPSEEERPLGE